MTKIIAAFIIIVVVWGGWELFLYWDKVKNEEETKQKQEEREMVSGDQLPGLAYQLEGSLQTARKQGPAGLKSWLKTHSQSVEDPRKAWIGPRARRAPASRSLRAVAPRAASVRRADLTRVSPRRAAPNTEAAKRRRAKIGPRARRAPASPVWPRIKKLEKTYE